MKPRAGGRTVASAIVATFFLALATSGCDASRSASRTTARTDPTLEPEEAAASTVRVRASGCGPRTELGTGTVIENGLVITAAHVVAGSDQITVAPPGSADREVTVVHFDPDLDLAVLQLASPLPDVAALRDGIAEPGERGVTATVTDDGEVEMLPVEVLRHVTVRTTDIYRDRDVERPGFEIDARIEPGDSGAMVHLPGGGVGVIWSRSTEDADRAWAIDLPALVRDPDLQDGLTAPVATGPCR